MENGTVELKATPNTGAMRYGVVTLYDRNGDKQQEVNITQDGVQIEPAQPENGKWYEVEAVGGKLTIHVVANSRWGVTKEIPSDETWYEFEQTEFNASNCARSPPTGGSGTGCTAGRRTQRNHHSLFPQ